MHLIQFGKNGGVAKYSYSFEKYFHFTPLFILVLHYKYERNTIVLLHYLNSYFPNQRFSYKPYDEPVKSVALKHNRT